MTGIFCVETGLAVFPQPAGMPAAGSPVWMTVRPDVRRGAAVAADLLVALGKNLTWHGKGRNENEDVLLARAWIHCLSVTALVVTNAQEAPLSTLDTLRDIAQQCGIDLWLLHRAPIDDRTHRKITKMATTTATLDRVPVPVARPSREVKCREEPTEAPDADFPTFRAAMLSDSARYAGALTAYTEQLHLTGAALTTRADTSVMLATAAVQVLRAAPDDGVLIARLRALQVLAWRHDLFLGIGTTTLMSSVERPRCAPDELDERLLSYRQPQRALVTGLTNRGIPLGAISTLTLEDVQPDGSLHGIAPIDAPSDENRLAARTQKRLRELEGAAPNDRLFAPDDKTLARFVNDAVADLGVNTAGRRVERELDLTTWLKRLGITLRAL